MASDEAPDAAGHDREEGGEETAQHARKRPPQGQAQGGVHRPGDVLLRQLDPREDILQDPGHGEQADEGREQVLIGDGHRHRAAIQQDEPQEAREQEGGQPSRQAPPAVPPAPPPGRGAVGSLGPLGEEHVGDHAPQDPVQVGLEDGPQGRQERWGDGRQQRQDRDAAQSSDTGQHHGLVAAPLEEISLPWEHDEDGRIVGGGQEDAGDRVEHRVPGGHPQEEHGQQFRWQTAPCLVQRGCGQHDEARDVVDVERWHEREHRRHERPGDGHQ